MSTRKLRSYFTLLSCTFYFFKLLGMATVSLSKNSLKDNKSASPILVHSKLGILYNLLLLSLVTSSNAFSIVILYENNYSEDVRFERIIDAVQNSFALCTCASVLIIFCFRQNPMIKLANEINSIRLSLLILNDNRLKSRSLRKDIVMVCFVVNLISWFMLVVTSSNSSILVFFGNFAIHLNVFIMNALVTLYIIVLKCIKYMFEVVNKDLRDMSTQSQKLKKVQFVSYNAHRLSHLQKVHSKLSNTTYDVSVLFSLPMLLCSFHNFLMLILSGYFIAKFILHGQTINSLQVFIHYLCHFILNLLPLIILTKSVSDTIFESKTAGKILSCCLEIYFKNEEIADNIELFLSYLPHSNVQFKVYDFFSLDESLLMSFVGSITTYLVILLQFEKPEAARANRTNTD